MGLAPLPDSALVLLADGIGEDLVGIAHSPFNSREVPLLDVSNDFLPVALTLVFDGLDAQLPARIGTCAHGDVDSP